MAMRYCPVLLSVIFATATFLRAEECPPFKPMVEEFPTSKYEQSTMDPVPKGYFLSDVLLMPSREWIVFVVESNHKNPRMSERVAVGYYHVASGRKRQLIIPPLPEQSESKVTIGEILPWEGNRCGVVTDFLPSPAAYGANGVKQPHGKAFLWEWDLVTDKVRLIGPWDGAMTIIAGFLGLGQCEVCWQRMPDIVRVGMNGEMNLRDISSGKTTDIYLKLGIGNLHTDGVTGIPTSSSCAFAVCDASDMDNNGHMDVRCIDPNAPNGIRWKLDKRALENTVKLGAGGAAFLQNVDPSERPLPLFVHCIVNNQCSSYLLFLDQKTGAITKKRKMPINTLSPGLPMISPDYRHAVFDVSDITGFGDENAVPADIATIKVIKQLRIVNVDTGKHKDTSNLSDKLDFCFLQGFLDNDSVVVSDDVAVWTLDTSGDLVLQNLFRLKGP